MTEGGRPRNDERGKARNDERGEDLAIMKEGRPRNDERGRLRNDRGRVPLSKKKEFILLGFDKTNMSILINPEIASSLRSSQ